MTNLQAMALWVIFGVTVGRLAGDALAFFMRHM